VEDKAGRGKRGGEGEVRREKGREWAGRELRPPTIY